MKQSNKKLAFYLRISREDKNCDESYSIQNQRKLLLNHAKGLGFKKSDIIEFIDDGITGTKRDREEFVNMTEKIKSGGVSAVMVKDLSRLGRDHILTDTYIEEFFPEHDVRFISVSEGLDSIKGDDEFTPFRNLMNEWYSRDISKKVKLSNVIKGNEGIPLSPPPYGYMKDPNSKKHWLVDPEASEVVKRIFNMSLDGLGTEQIANALDNDMVLTPLNYWQSKGLKRGGIKNEQSQSHWNASTVGNILRLQEYCGDIINFKTYSKSFKLKKRIDNKDEDKAVFKDVNDPIVDRLTFEKIQQKIGKSRKRKTNDGEKNIFSGLLVWASIF